MKTALFVITIIAAVISGIFLFVGFYTANGAPQQAAAGAVAAAFTIIPYCLARGFEALEKK
jgi:hypothetical protein